MINDGTSRLVREVKQAIGKGTDEAIFWIQRHITGNNRGYQAQGSWDSPASLRFAKG